MTKQQLEESVAYLQHKGFEKPEIGIVLGTGLGKVADLIENPSIAHYTQIPFFPLSTVEFHSGKLIYGDFQGKKVVVMQGRFHLYEGYDLIDITYPIRVMHALGIKKLLVSNAAGALNLSYKKGEMMLINDHINLQIGSPLAFKNVSEFGERFVNLNQPYDKEMNHKFKEIAKKHGIVLHEGVYAAMVGPQLETRAEYRFLRMIGGDAVGMSTVPEIIVANHLGLPVSAVSVITDECDPENLKEVDLDSIIAAAEEAEPKMVTLFRELVASL
ncbi:purine-nucleoside phosphorylase [Zhouia sp. PK063]|uniref:purine-nucleoside phosphorylase n=1 Tax=Zhouia sp. PK063 TaxID=3373602 RepID=UPI00378985E3